MAPLYHFYVFFKARHRFCALPDVAEHCYAAETEGNSLAGVGGGNATEGYDPVVNDAVAMGAAQLVIGEGGTVALLGDAVEDRAEEDIVDVLLVGLHLFKGVTGVEVMAVHHYTVSERCVYLRYKSIQLFCCGVGLAQMEDG